MLIPKTNKRGVKGAKKGVKGPEVEKRARLETAPGAITQPPATVAETKAWNANSILVEPFFSLDCSSNALVEVSQNDSEKI